MKKFTIGVISLCLSSVLYADKNLTEKITEQNEVMQKVEAKKTSEMKKSEGYSFFRTAMQHISYEERYVYKKNHPLQGIQKGDVQTNNFSGTNLVTIGGNLSPINDKYDFSFETISTLIPQQINEEWTVGGRSNQKDDATIDFTQLRFLMHQKFTPQHRAVGGLEFKKMSFERYNLRTFDENSNLLQTSMNTIRERSSSLSLDAGYWYESKNIGKSGWHYNALALIKVPLWQNTENTASPDVSFSDPSGYDFDLEVGASYTIFKNIDLGLVAGYGYSYRSGESKGGVNWPENRFKAYTLGFSFLWNL